MYTQVGATAAAIASAHQHNALHSQLVEYMEQRETVGPAPPPTEQQQPPPPPTTGQPPAEPGPTTEQQQQQQPPPPTTGQPPAEPGPTTEQQQQQPAEDTGQQPPQSSPSTEDPDKVTEVDHVLASCAHFHSLLVRLQRKLQKLKLNLKALLRMKK